MRKRKMPYPNLGRCHANKQCIKQNEDDKIAQLTIGKAACDLRNSVKTKITVCQHYDW